MFDLNNWNPEKLEAGLVQGPHYHEAIAERTLEIVARLYKKGESLQETCKFISELMTDQPTNKILAVYMGQVDPDPGYDMAIQGYLSALHEYDPTEIHPAVIERSSRIVVENGRLAP